MFLSNFIRCNRNGRNVLNFPINTVNFSKSVQIRNLIRKCPIFYIFKRKLVVAPTKGVIYYLSVSAKYRRLILKKNRKLCIGCSLNIICTMKNVETIVQRCHERHERTPKSDPGIFVENNMAVQVPTCKKNVLN